MSKIKFLGNKLGRLAKFTRLQQKKMICVQIFKVHTLCKCGIVRSYVLVQHTYELTTYHCYSSCTSGRHCTCFTVNLTGIVPSIIQHKTIDHYSALSEGRVCAIYCFICKYHPLESPRDVWGRKTIS